MTKDHLLALLCIFTDVDGDVAAASKLACYIVIYHPKLVLITLANMCDDKK